MKDFEVRRNFEYFYGSVDDFLAYFAELFPVTVDEDQQFVELIETETTSQYSNLDLV